MRNGEMKMVCIVSKNRIVVEVGIVGVVEDVSEDRRVLVGRWWFLRIFSFCSIQQNAQQDQAVLCSLTNSVMMKVLVAAANVRLKVVAKENANVNAKVKVMVMVNVDR